jgi:hypothetical protein
MHHATQLQPIGGIFLHENADFGASIKEMTDLADGIRKSKMPPQIPIAKAQQMIRLIDKAVAKFQENGNRIINDGASYFVRDPLRAAVRQVGHEYTSKVTNKLTASVNAAAARGETTVASHEFNYRSMPLMLYAIANGYDTLSLIDSFKPWFLKMVPSYTIGIFGAIAKLVVSVAVFVARTLTAAIEAASKTTETIIALLKWGSVAGGLYLLYGALKPEKK